MKQTKGKGVYSQEHKRLVKRLVKARIKVGLTQTEAAKLLGKSQSYIAKIEVGQRKIDVIELKRLSKLYKKPINYFLE
jgi:transcriptional regulator with XRE-family HTH domain